MDIEQALDEIGFSGARYPAFAANPERLHMTACCSDARTCAFDAVLCVNDSQIEFCSLSKPKVVERLEEAIICPLDWDRHMNERERMHDALHHCVRKFDQLSCIARLNKMPCLEVAVAKVYAQLDVARHRL